MASSLTLSDTSSTANGWVIVDVDETILTETDELSLPLSSSADTLLMDYGGRRRRINIRGHIIEGTALGTGSFSGITNIGSQIEHLDSYFFNNTAGGVQLLLARAARTTISGTATWRHRESAGDTQKEEFMITFTEGVLL